MRPATARLHVLCSTTVFVSVVCSIPALAECPTRASLAAGEPAYVAYPDGSIVDLRWLGDGRVQETTRFPDRTGEFRMVSVGGVFIVDEVDLDGETELDYSRITSTYPATLSAHVPLAANTEFAVAAVNSFADGTPAEEEHISVRTGGLATIDIAGCPYEGFPVLITYRWGVESFTSMMTHLPDLGVSLELARMDQGADPEPFAPVWFDLDPP
ncbi:hypothetical protein [Tropicimonas marinistellae]|uniref:hypothetical protein n=1 Tax=Tropicimonas marinistellae TaxID=1739787 RepID=UPI000831286A|nr:hypothetical protein [Tropicimonas marinistellae]